MAEQKPNFALDLSNDGIALWHRSGGSGWSSLAKISLNDPDLEAKLKAMRSKALAKGQPLKAVVRIPKPEVLLSRVKLGVFEGEAATLHALKQINGLTSYALEDVVYDMGDKSAGNMAPVAVAARTTLEEAKEFAHQQGFTPVYFTTQYTTKEFPREPRFYLIPPKKSLLPPVSKIAAAAAIGLTIGYFGYVNLIAPGPETGTTSPAAQNDPAETGSQTKTSGVTATAQLADPENTADIERQPKFTAAQVATLLAPKTTQYPELLLDKLEQFSFDRLVRLARPTAGDFHDAPSVQLASAEIKTDALILFEAHRDLPEVAMTDDSIVILQSSMSLSTPAETVPETPLVLASLTAQDTRFPSVTGDILATPANTYTPPPEDAATLPDPPPPAYVTAEPGTLTPTPEGTLGPQNILIYSGKPNLVSRARPVFASLRDPLAIFRARARPEGLLSAEQSAAREAEAIISGASDTPPVVAVEVASLVETSTQPANLPETAPLFVSERPTEADAPASQPALLNTPAEADTAPETPIIIASAPVNTLAPTATATVSIDTIEDPDALLAMADPTLIGIKPRSRPSNLKIPVIPDPNDLLARADPTLIGIKPRIRPSNLKVPVVPDPVDLLARADPTLSGFRAKNRPANLKIPAEIIEPPSVPTLDSATSLAVATSLVPKTRPAKIASIAAKLTLPSDTTVTAITPDAAIGTSRPSDGPTPTTVAKAATEKSKFNKKKMNLVGVFGTPNDRRALVRLASGRYVKVKKGDRLSGWKVSAIGESSVRIRKGSKDQVLRLP